MFSYIAVVCSILDGIAYSASLNDDIEKTTKHSFLVLVFILTCLPKAVFIEIFEQNRLSFAKKFCSKASWTLNGGKL